MNTWVPTREVANWLNLSTLGGLALALAARCPVARGERGIILAGNYTPGLPKAGAFTVGNVVFFRAPTNGPAPDSRLLGHEETHSTQYALCLGLPFIPLYFAAAAYSWLRTSDPASRNIFERAAGLQAGGYREAPVRKLGPVLAAQLRNVLRTGPKTTPAAPTGGTP